MPEAFFEGDPQDTEEQILRAAFTALCEGGYADLTVERIGREFEKSPSLIYHHYDGKDDLLVDLLEYVLDRFESQWPDPEMPVEPEAKLRWYVERVYSPEVAANSPGEVTFWRALVALRAQAASDPAYQAHFQRSDAVFEAFLEEIIRDGVESGSFREVDPEGVAATLHTLGIGTFVRLVTSGDEGWTEDVRRQAVRYLEHSVFRDE